MLKPSTRKITAKPAAVKAATVAVAKAANAARAAIVKPVTATAIVAPVATVPTPAATANAVAIVNAAAKPSGNVTRTAKTIAAQATNFGSLSDRDTAYLAFYKRLAAANGGTVTVAGIVASGERPSYIGSNKPHDAGVIVRLTKAALIASAADGHSFTVTALGTSTKA